jgi:hypothetical protein
MHITLPTVHLNGTSYKELRRSYDSADDALHDLIKAWERMTFHPRDYYLEGADAWGKALEARQEISRKLLDIKAYLYAHLEHLDQMELDRKNL